MSETAEMAAGTSNGRPSVDVFAEHDPSVKVRTKKMLMWFIIFAIIMLFAGITSALIVLYGKLLWVHIAPPTAFWAGLGLLLASSVTYILALRSVKAGQQQRAFWMVAITFLLGVGFVYSQNAGWGELSSDGMGYTITTAESGQKAYKWNAIGRLKGEYGTDFSFEYRGEPLVKNGNDYYLASDTALANPLTTEVMTTFNASGAMLSVLVYVHILHLAFGLLYLLVNLVRIRKGRIHQGNWISLHTGGMYWHFMGILWGYLFFFLFFVY